MKKLLIALFILALGISLGGSAYALDLKVDATVGEACTFATNLLSFGSNYDATGDIFEETPGSVVLNCTLDTDFEISIGPGAFGSTGIDATRREVEFIDLNNDSWTIAYDLYQNLGRSTLWGDGTFAGATRVGTGTGFGPGTSQLAPVYGILRNGDPVPAGTYADYPIVTVNILP